jgi:hypothetical protein
MLLNARDLQGLPIHATDGELGKVDEFLFDDRSWAVRYLVVDTGPWLLGQQVLIAPASIGAVDWGAGWLPVNLTREQVENSPSIESHLPVSRQHEEELSQYYGWPAYWGEAGVWGGGIYPMMGPPMGAVGPEWEAAVGAPTAEEARERMAEGQEGDPHLRSTKEVAGYHLHATDGDIGHVETFLIEDGTWAIRYLIVDTRNWWPGKKVLLPPQVIRAVSWAQALVDVDLTRDQIRSAPEWDPLLTSIDRDYETRLFEHYGRPGYWATPPGSAAPPPAVGDASA